MAGDWELFVRILGAILVGVAGALAFVHYRRLAIDAAQARLATIQTDTISSLQSHNAVLERQVDLLNNRVRELVADLARLGQLVQDQHEQIETFWRADQAANGHGRDGS